MEWDGERIINSLREFKQSLLQKAFSGKPFADCEVDWVMA